MTPDNGNKVAEAFAVLLKEVEAQISLTNEAGAQAFEQRDYDQARQVLERAKQLGELRDRVVALRRDWDDISAPPAGPSVEKGLAPRLKMHFEFWQAFMQRAAGRVPLPSRLGRGVGSAIYAPAGARQLWWNYTIRRRDARVDLALYRQDAAENKGLYDTLFARRVDIERAFGAPLEWDRYDQGRGSYIRYKLTGGGLLAREAWPEIQERMIEAIGRFKSALDPEIQELPDVAGTVSAPAGTKKVLAPRHLMRREFWQAFMQRAAGRVPLPSRLGKGIYTGIYAPAAKKRLYWEYYIRMRDAGLDLGIYRQDAAENKRLFDRLFARREEIERTFSAALDWDRNDGGSGCVIRYKIAGGGLLARETWPEIQERMIETILRFQKAFAPALQELPD